MAVTLSLNSSVKVDFSLGFSGLLLGRSSSAKQITTKGPFVFWIKGPQACESIYWRRRTVWTRERKRNVSEGSSLFTQSSNDPSLILYLTSPFILPESLTLLAFLTWSTIFVWSPIFSVHLPLFPAHYQFYSHNISGYLNDRCNVPVISPLPLLPQELLTDVSHNSPFYLQFC